MEAARGEPLRHLPAFKVASQDGVGAAGEDDHSRAIAFAILRLKRGDGGNVEAAGPLGFRRGPGPQGNGADAEVRIVLARFGAGPILRVRRRAYAKRNQKQKKKSPHGKHTPTLAAIIGDGNWRANADAARARPAYGRCSCWRHAWQWSQPIAGRDAQSTRPRHAHALAALRRAAARW